MGYHKVGTPRFYVDQIQYLKAIGFDFKKAYEDVGLSLQYQTMINIPNLFTLNPEIRELIHEASDDTAAYIRIPTGFSNDINLSGNNVGYFLYILNHDLNTDNIRAYNRWYNYNESLLESATENSILNFDSENSVIPNNGSSIYTFTENPPDKDYSFLVFYFKDADSTAILPSFSAGAVSFGIYYDMTYNADLSLTMELDYSGYELTQNLEGSTLSNITHNGAPWWYDSDGNKKEPWAIGDSTGLGKRNGRRIWNLSFSYMSDSDLFASNYMNNNYTETSTNYGDNIAQDADNNDYFYYTIEDDNSFHAQVLNKICLGQKFIFQADNTNNNPDQFAIAILDQDSFSCERVAPNVYNINMTIKEVW
tara:strand:- start:656 stop:1750 length:1095 start_codon:yes stop_codon:yes gene_type:complete